MGHSRPRHDDSDNPSSDTAYQESLRTRAKRHGINPKTVAEWRKRSFVADLPSDGRLSWKPNHSSKDRSPRGTGAQNRSSEDRNA